MTHETKNAEPEKKITEEEPKKTASKSSKRSKKEDDTNVTSEELKDSQEETKVLKYAEQIEALNQDGFVVLSGLLDKKHVDDFLKELNKTCLKINKEHAWENPKSKHGWSASGSTQTTPYYHGLAHLNSLWKIREDAEISNFYEEVYGTDKLLVSMEPPAVYTTKLSSSTACVDHVETESVTGAKIKVAPFAAIRMSILMQTEEDCGSSGVFTFFKGSHKTIKEHIQSNYPKHHFSKPLSLVESTSKTYIESHDSVRLALKEGDAVVYYASCVRYTQMPTASTDIWVDISMQPSAWASEYDIKKRSDAFVDGRGTGCISVVKPILVRIPKSPEQSFHISTPTLTERGWCLLHKTKKSLVMDAAAGMTKKRKESEGDKSPSQAQTPVPTSGSNGSKKRPTEEQPRKKVIVEDDETETVLKLVEVDVKVDGKPVKNLRFYV